MEEKEILACFSREAFLPEHAKTIVPKTQQECMVKPKKKLIRKVYPSEEDQIKLLVIDQNSAFWQDNRKTQFGASVIASFHGDDNVYSTNTICYYEDSGKLVKQKSMKYNDYLPLDRGHYYEDEVVKLYCFLFHAKHYTVGMLLNFMYCYLHVSPDGLIEFSPGVLPNKYTINDGLRGGLEIKNPIMKAYCTSTLKQNTIKPCYVGQLQMQMFTFGWNFVDFAVYWKTNELCPPYLILSEDSNNETKTSKKTKTKRKRNQVELSHQDTRKYLVAELRVTRVYRSERIINRILQELAIHKNHLEKQDTLIPLDIKEIDFQGSIENYYSYKFPNIRSPNQREDLEVHLEIVFDHLEPKVDNYQIDLNNLDFCYNKQTKTLELFPLAMSKKQFYDLFVGKFSQHNFNLLDPQFINTKSKIQLVISYPPKLYRFLFMDPFIMLPLKHVQIFSEIQKDPETNIFPPIIQDRMITGKLTVQEDDKLFEQKPLQVHIHDLDNEEKMIKLDAVPKIENHYSFQHIVNPVLIEKHQQNPDLSFMDLLFQFSNRTLPSDLA